MHNLSCVSGGLLITADIVVNLRSLNDFIFSLLYLSAVPTLEQLLSDLAKVGFFLTSEVDVDSFLVK